jgi:hypothetical protein
VCKELGARGHEVVLLGRRRAALQELAKVIGAKEVRVADCDLPSTLQPACEGLAALVACAGPYTRFGFPVAEAAVANGTHYVDVTGEPQYVLRLIQQLDGPARDRGVALVPGVAAMCVTGDLAAADAVSRVGGAVQSVVVGYRLAVLRPSPGTVSSYAHIFADGALSVREGVLVKVAPGSRVVSFQSRRGLTTPAVDPAAISRWCDAPEIGAYLLSPAAQVTPHVVRGLSRLARIPAVRSGWERLGQRLPAHPGDPSSERWFAEAVVTGPHGQTVTRAHAQGAYSFTSRAAALAAAAVTNGAGVHGVCGPSHVLDSDAATALGMRFEHLDDLRDARRR